jgi:hypothetical protein
MPEDNPYLIDKYASCKTPNTDRVAGCPRSFVFRLPDRTKAGVFAPGENCSGFNLGRSSTGFRGSAGSS